MVATQYRVVISGRTLSGAPLADCKAEVGRVFRLAGEQLEQLLSGKPTVVAKQLSADAADKLLVRLQALDLDARREVMPTASATPALSDTPPPTPSPAVAPVHPPSVTPAGAKADDLFALTPPNAAPTAGVTGEVTCPKCGEIQPKRTLCRACGLDMPRFHAAQEAARQEAHAAIAAKAAGGAAVGARQAAMAGFAEPVSAPLFGIGFSGRFGRLDYLAGSLVSMGVWLLFVLLSMAAGKPAIAALGILLSTIYGFRSLALRLHDTGRTGWLSLVALVPLVGMLMCLALLLIPGEDGENRFGPPVAGGGRHMLLMLGVVVLAFALGYRNISQSPEKMLRFLQAVGGGQGGVEMSAAEDDDDTPPAGGAANYARNNRIDIYVIAGCADCERLRGWLNANGLAYTEYTVDSDPRAAERLHSIIGNEGNIQLPVVEVNGKVLPGNPELADIHRQLRQAAPSS